uniref:Uncharacterized protein n=1 Tax=uncultured prokaryote TaxID=198431 RepID=A0A0H5QNW2_9ZZZZ|nr:hypothetical protein [uncultured prokaryote]
MKQTLKYAGLNDSASGLTIFLEQSVGTSKRVRTVVIPWEELIDRKTLDYIDKAIRARMIAAWEGPDEIDRVIPGLC